MPDALGGRGWTWSTLRGKDKGGGDGREPCEGEGRLELEHGGMEEEGKGRSATCPSLSVDDRVDGRERVRVSEWNVELKSTVRCEM